MRLVECGVPYDLAMCMDTDERLAHLIAIGENHGGEFDLERMEWTREPQT